jgi:hypothetical protein
MKSMRGFDTVRLSLFIPALAPPAPQFWGEKAEN